MANEPNTPPAKPAKYKTPGLRIAARTESFRRCGVDHTAAATDHAPGTFSPEQVEQLKAEPNLVVVELA